MLARFHQLHERAYGFSSPDEPCEVVTLRVAATAELERRLSEHRPAQGGSSEPVGERQVFDLELGRVATPVYERDALAAGAVIDGPAVVHQIDATTFVPSFASAEVDDKGNLLITVREASS